MENDDLAKRFRSRIEDDFMLQALVRICYHFMSDTEDTTPHQIIEEKLKYLTIVAVDKIVIVITDTKGCEIPNSEDLICFLDKNRDTILFKADLSCRERVPVEATIVLNQYFERMFQNSLIYVEMLFQKFCNILLFIITKTLNQHFQVFLHIYNVWF